MTPESLAPVDDDEFIKLVKGEKTRLLYKGLHFVLTGNFLVSAILAYGLWNYVDHDKLLTWLGFLYLLTIVRIPIIRSYFNKSRIEQDQPRWGNYFFLSSILSGIIWGLSGIIFFMPENPLVLSYLTVVLLGMIAGSTSALSSHTPTHYGFIIPAILPFTYSYMTNPIPLGLPVGSLTIFFLIMIMAFSRNIERALTETISLRFKNAMLIESLTSEKERAEAASNAKSRFLASASHDLRQPLHALGLFVGAMEHHSTSKELQELVGKTKQSYTALEGLLDVLLDISKLDAGVIQPRPEALEVQNLFNKLHTEFEDKARRKGLSLNFHNTAFWIKSDETLLLRILRNLISNAIRYTDSGGILVGCRYRFDKILIEVHDTGSGIPADQIKEIFKEFRQLVNPERDRNKGLGLGLAIVDRLSQLLNHPVMVHSSPGKGSTFSLLLPLALNEQREKPVSSPGPVIVDRLAGLKILVIDDESDILEGMRHLLTTWGCSTSVAETTEQACLFLKSHDWIPDIILIDYRLRNNQTGAEAIEIIHECLGASIPAIIITGDTAPDRIQQAKQSGYPVLHKPIQPARLRNVLQQQIND